MPFSTLTSADIIRGETYRFQDIDCPSFVGTEWVAVEPYSANACRFRLAKDNPPGRGTAYRIGDILALNTGYFEPARKSQAGLLFT